MFSCLGSYSASAVPINDLSNLLKIRVIRVCFVCLNRSGRQVLAILAGPRRAFPDSCRLQHREGTFFDFGNDAVDVGHSFGAVVGCRV